MDDKKIFEEMVNILKAVCQESGPFGKGDAGYAYFK